MLPGPGKDKGDAKGHRERAVGPNTRVRRGCWREGYPWLLPTAGGWAFTSVLYCSVTPYGLQEALGLTPFYREDTELGRAPRVGTVQPPGSW